MYFGLSEVALRGVLTSGVPSVRGYTIMVCSFLMKTMYLPMLHVRNGDSVQ